MRESRSSVDVVSVSAQAADPGLLTAPKVARLSCIVFKITSAADQVAERSEPRTGLPDLP